MTVKASEIAMDLMLLAQARDPYGFEDEISSLNDFYDYFFSIESDISENNIAAYLDVLNAEIIEGSPDIAEKACRIKQKLETFCLAS